MPGLKITIPEADFRPDHLRPKCVELILRLHPVPSPREVEARRLSVHQVRFHQDRRSKMVKAVCEATGLRLEQVHNLDGQRIRVTAEQFGLMAARSIAYTGSSRFHPTRPGSVEVHGADELPMHGTVDLTGRAGASPAAFVGDSMVRVNSARLSFHDPYRGFVEDLRAPQSKTTQAMYAAYGRGPRHFSAPAVDVVWQGVNDPKVREGALLKAAEMADRTYSFAYADADGKLVAKVGLDGVLVTRETADPRVELDGFGDVELWQGERSRLKVTKILRPSRATVFRVGSLELPAVRVRQFVRDASEPRSIDAEFAPKLVEVEVVVALPFRGHSRGEIIKAKRRDVTAADGSTTSVYRLGGGFHVPASYVVELKR